MQHSVGSRFKADCHSNEIIFGHLVLKITLLLIGDVFWNWQRILPIQISLLCVAQINAVPSLPPPPLCPLSPLPPFHFLFYSCSSNRSNCSTVGPKDSCLNASEEVTQQSICCLPVSSSSWHAFRQRAFPLSKWTNS